MTKGERRKARKAARAAGCPLTGELAIDPLDSGDRDTGPCEFSESARGYEARHRWAKWYDDLNGAPESEYDR